MKFFNVPKRAQNYLEFWNNLDTNKTVFSKISFLGATLRILTGRSVECATSVVTNSEHGRGWVGDAGCCRPQVGQGNRLEEEYAGGKCVRVPQGGRDHKKTAENWGKCDSTLFRPSLQSKHFPPSGQTTTTLSI